MTTKQQLKEAYQLVRQDLLNAFIMMKNGEKIRLPQIGVFEKKLKKGKSHLPTSYGQKYARYYLGFKMSSVLKQELN